jgi:transposase
MGRRRFGRQFKIASVRLIKERGVSVAPAARDLDVHENVLRKWVTGVLLRPRSGLPWARPDEARTARDRAASPGGRQAEGGA